MGAWTEELNRHWFERQTGLVVTREGERIVHPQYPYLAATLDGVTTIHVGGDEAVFEAKHVREGTTLKTVVDRYYAQLMHQMFVTGFRHAALSVFVGTMDWECVFVEFDPLYHAELLAAEQEFWRHVTRDTPP